MTPSGSSDNATVVKCPHCKDGTVVHRGAGLWWQDRRGRCAWCQGVGWIYEENTEEVRSADSSED